MSPQPLRKVRALHTIYQRVGDGLVHTGLFDQDGEPVLRADITIRQPGAVFLPNDQAELDAFIENEAVEVVTERVGVIYE